MTTLTPKPRKQGRARTRKNSEIAEIITPIIKRCGIGYETLTDPNDRTERVLMMRKAVIHVAACNGLSYRAIGKVLNMSGKLAGDYDRDAVKQYKENNHFRNLVDWIAGI